MKLGQAIVLSLLILLLLGLTGNQLRAGAPPQAGVVTVVSLGDQGQPQRQGLGVLVAPDDLLLTSWEIFADAQGGVMVSPQGTMHLIDGVVYQDPLQDLALIKVEAAGLKPAPPGQSRQVKIGDRLWLPAREQSRVTFKEARVKGFHPISPRLQLLELAAAGTAAAPGTPVFNPAGEVVALGHQVMAENGQSTGYYLLLNPEFWRRAVKAAKNAAAGPEIAAATGPNSPERQFWEGLAALGAQDWRGAEQKFRAALKLNPEFPEAYYGRAQARFGQEDFCGAEQDLEQAVKHLPGYAQAYFWLGKTRQQLSQPDAAIQAYETAVRLNPNFPEAHFQLGRLAYEAKDWQRAQSCFAQARQGSDQAARSWWYLGTMAQRRGRITQAAENFRKALELDAQFFEACLSLGKLLVSEDEPPQEAVQILTQAVQQRPQHSEARFYLALAQWLSWNRGGALEQYFALQDLNPRLAERLHRAMNHGR